MKLLENLKVRLQYTFSEAESMVRASGSTCAACTAATNYPNVTNRWHEFLTRLDYQLHKNVTLRFGYYFNRFNHKDFGVDIMKPWMGDVDTNAGNQRSIWLGDRIKRPYTAHVGLLGLRLSF
jgi:opacity protein-like surface antigen